MEEILIKLRSLEQAMRSALIVKNSLLKEIGQLKAINEQLQVEKQSILDSQQRLNDELKSVKLAHSLSSSADQGSRELKTQINAYIKEIDKCINILKSEIH